MCAWCKRIKEPGGKWHEPVETPVLRQLNHGICLECAAEFFGNTGETNTLDGGDDE